MKTKLILCATAIALGLAGCAAPAVISDISDSSLKVQHNSLTPQSEVDAEAARGCALYNKTAERISFVQLPGGYEMRETLYACM